MDKRVFKAKIEITSTRIEHHTLKITEGEIKSFVEDLREWCLTPELIPDLTLEDMFICISGPASLNYFKNIELEMRRRCVEGTYITTLAQEMEDFFQTELLNNEVFYAEECDIEVNPRNNAEYSIEYDN